METIAFGLSLKDAFIIGALFAFLAGLFRRLMG